MFQAMISAYPWDVMDEGVASVLDRLHGEIGATGLALWVGSPPVTQLRTIPLEPRVFRTRGGLFLQPARERYEGTRCQPVLSTWLKGRNPLEKIAAGCAERGLTLRVIVSAAATGRLARRHPEAACKNVFDAESHISVCLANPDVQGYLCSLAGDLSSNYELAELSLTDFASGWFEARTIGLRPARPLGDTERALLALCFCESCHQRAIEADVDAAGAKRAALAVVQKALDRGAPTDLDFNALLTDTAPLAEYVRHQSAVCSALLRRLTEACTCALLLDRSPWATQDCDHEAVDFSIPDGVLTLVDSANALRSASCPGARRNELRLPEGFITRHGGQELVAALAKAAEVGFAGVQIDNWGLLPRIGATAIRQAIRFARRARND